MAVRSSVLIKSEMFNTSGNTISFCILNSEFCICRRRSDDTVSYYYSGKSLLERVSEHHCVQCVIPTAAEGEVEESPPEM